MKNKIILVMTYLLIIFIFASMLYAQNNAKTIKLNNGDEVWDLTGAWDVLVEPYGEWIGESYRVMLSITQTGNSFMAIRTKDDIAGNRQGSLALEGELDKSGIKKLTLFSSDKEIRMKGTIREDGNKMIFDAANRIKWTVTRK